GYTITSPLAPHIGLEISIDSIKLESKQSKEKAIHKAIAEFIDAGKDSLVEFSLPTEIIDTQAYTWAGFDVSPRHTYHIDLNQSEEQLLNSMSSERRKNIRKAQEDGLRVEIVRDTDRFRSIVQKTIKRQRISIDQGILDKVLMSEYLDEYRSMYVCSFQGRDLAASLIVHDEHRSYYLIGGYDSSNSHSGAGTLNLWKAILDSKRRANKVFDLEGSMIPEVERYFRGFGGKLKTYFSIERKSTLANIAKRIKGS
ncbi:MAG: peptidoglycan bridge formation glycyltransferase FemA/FemB family protein, partial [Flavobacteriales bacterium]|nr:peptidoglycan bridge formation glycyltransferase FemA/FemB family protein [Flavobacteriales bacterium]